jgi:hypothetical protein
MLDRIKRSSDTNADTPKESRVVTSPKPIIEAESETDQIVREISKSRKFLDGIRSAIADWKAGRVQTRKQAIAILKKRAS